MRILGIILLASAILAAIGAPALAPYGPRQEFRDYLHAPPMRPRITDPQQRPRAPFVYSWRLVNRLEQRYEEDRSRPVKLLWFSGGKIVRVEPDGVDRGGPLLLLGADSFGRDIFTRLLYGGRTSLAVALTATLGALVLGTLIGGLAGYVGGAIDEGLMRVSEFVLVLPAIYVVLALRAVMPLVLPATTVFVLMAGILALVGWPYVARGVRTAIGAERQRDYSLAAVSLGAGHSRLLFKHLLPASGGFLAVQATVLLPAFILAEATLSYVGLGFPDPVPSWGSMLHDAASVSSIVEFPWTLAPAGAIFLVVLAFNLIVQGAGADPLSAARLTAAIDNSYLAPVRSTVRQDLTRCN